MRNAARSNPLLQRVDYGAMLVTLVQSVVRSFDKHLSPLDQGRGKESRDRAKNHLLKKSRVHLSVSRSSVSARCGNLYQNPHCLVVIIQRPRSKLVTACVKM